MRSCCLGAAPAPQGVPERRCRRRPGTKVRRCARRDGSTASRLSGPSATSRRRAAPGRRDRHPRRASDGVAAVVGAGQRVGPGRQEQLGQLDVAALGRLVQRREAAVLGRVHVGAGAQQQAADLDRATGRRGMERLVGEVVRPYASTEAPASSRTRAASVLPKKAARWRAVNPSPAKAVARAGILLQAMRATGRRGPARRRRTRPCPGRRPGGRRSSARSNR